MIVKRGVLLVILTALSVVYSSVFALSPFLGDFENLDIEDPNALADSGWWGDVYFVNPIGENCGIQAFGAPNDSVSCGIVSSLGVEGQENQQLRFAYLLSECLGEYSLATFKLYQGQEVHAEDLGETWQFMFQARSQDLQNASLRAIIWMSVGISGITYVITQDDLNLGEDSWSDHSLQVTIVPELVGTTIKFGFQIHCDFELMTDHGGAVFDNVRWEKHPASPVIDGGRQARSVELSQCFPNPFNPQTTIAFEIPRQQDVTLRIFDLSGRLVRDLIVGESRSPGRHEIVWNGRDDAGKQVASGAYFYRLEAGEFAETKRMVLVK